MKKRLVAFLLVLIMVLGMLPTAALAGGPRGPRPEKDVEKQSIRYKILYIDDSFYLGYSYGAEVTKEYVCQYSSCGSNSYNHSILISEFKNVGVPALQDRLDSGYEFVGWAKEDKANAQIFDFNMAGTTATQTTYTIWLVAKKPAPTQYTYTLNFDGNGDGVSNVPGQLTYTGLETNYSFTIPSAVPTRDGYDFKGWNTTASATTARWQPGDAFKMNVEVRTATLYAIWEETRVEPVGPTKPTEDELKSLELANVYCAEGKSQHYTMNYGLLDGALVSVSEITEDKTCTVTLNVAPYVTAYNAEITDSAHARKEGDPATVTAELSYNDETGKWTVGRKASIAVYCENKPVTPEKPTADDLKSISLRIECSGSSTIFHKHNAKLYPLVDGTTYDIKNIDDAQKDGFTYRCKVSVDSTPYVDAYIKEAVDSGLGNHTGTRAWYDMYLYWDDTTKTWVTEKKDGVIGTVYVVPEKYTVTYTDGANGEVFDDQVTSNLYYNQDTPAFNGDTPTRDGYTFTGWNPEVAEKVTETVTYTATWSAEAPTEIPNVSTVRVRVECVDEDNATAHSISDYAVIQNYGTSEKGIEKIGDDYFYSFTLSEATREYYISDYSKISINNKPRGTHLEVDGPADLTFTWKWVNGAWVLQNKIIEDHPVAPVAARIKVKCVIEPNGTNGLDPVMVKVKCVNNDNHPANYFGIPLNPGTSYTVNGLEKKDDGYYYSITLNKAPFITMYNKTPFENMREHTEAAGSTDMTITWKWINGEWVCQNDVLAKGGVDAPADAVVCINVAHPYFVTFDSNGGTAVDAQTVANGEKATKPADPTKDGYNFLGWYLDDAEYDFDTVVTEDITLTAKWELISHNIYAFARLNNAFCSLTPVEFGESVQLNAATLKRLGLNAYNENGYISIGKFNFADMPLTEDMYMSYYNENEFNAVVAALEDDLALEKDVDAATAAMIDWTVLFKADDSEYMTTAGYPTDDADGYQLSGNLNVAAVMFNAGADDVENMPAVNYTYDGVIDFYDFYLPGQTVTMPEDPTRAGYNFLGWSAQVIPGVEDASEPLAASETETLYKAGDTYTITDGGVVFTAVWEARTDTHYKVKYYIETLDGKWTLNDTFEGKGTTGETIDATKVKNKKYEHYTLDLTVEGTEQFGVIAGDGSLVLKLYYTRNTYTYYVHHVKQLPDGSYDTDKAEVETLTGKYGAPAVVVAKDYGPHYPTNDAASKQDKTVDVDLVIVVKYDLDNHTLTFNSNGGTPVDAVTVRHGNTVAKPADPTKEGNWRFKDWYIDEACITPYDFSTPLEEDRTVYAGYDKTSSPLNPIVQMYEIQHIKQLPDGTYDEANAVIERNFAEEGTEINATAKDFGTHYVLNTEKSTMTGKVVKVTTGEDEKPVYTVLKVYYDLDNHTLTFDPNGGSAVNPDKVTVRHGAPVTDGPLLPPTKTGYNFTGWYLDKNAKTAFDASAGITEDTTVYAGWTPASPVVVVYKLTVNYVFQNGRTAAPSAVLELVPGASYNVESPKLASYNADRLAVKGIMPDHDVTETVTYYPQGAILPTAKKAPKLNTTEHFAYVQGYPNGTVKPAGNITRAETAAILFRLMTADTRSTYYSTKSGFRDVSTSAWYNTYVATLNAAGVITDSANGYFRPNDAITRAELAAMLAQFADATKAANYFTDVSASYWASNAIAVCSKLGWINGYPDGTFRPDKNVTRAEMMAMINRATGRTPQSADAFLPGMKTWTDNAATAWYYLDVQEATNSHSYTKKGNAELWSGLTSDPNWSLYE